MLNKGEAVFLILLAGSIVIPLLFLQCFNKLPKKLETSHKNLVQIQI